MTKISKNLIKLKYFLAGLAIVNSTCWAQQFEFSEQQEQQYWQLIQQTRCVVCQNNSLAESQAPLALDLRRRIAEMVLQNKPTAEIKQFLINRYGDFIFYLPPFNYKTYLLWCSPALILLILLYILWRYIIVTKKNMATAQQASPVEINAQVAKWQQQYGDKP